MSEESRMKKTIIRIAVCVVVFLASALIIGSIMNQGHNNMTMEMAPATLPMITMESGGVACNELHGNTVEMHPIPSAGSSKASSQLHSDCLAPSGSSLISIPLLLFLFIAFHFLFYIITYLFRVPQGVILSILLIYFNLLYFKTENLHNLPV